MRHLVSLMFGIVLAPVIWFLAALGHYRLLAALPRDGSPGGASTGLAMGALLIVAAGIWLGILLGTRLSPVGPVLAGVLWLGLGAAFILDAKTVAALFPNGPTGQEGLFTLPLEHGYAYLIGTALLVPLFSPARWRGRERDSEDDEEVVLAPYGGFDEPTPGGRHGTSNVQPAVPNRYRSHGAERGWSGAREEDARASDTGAIQPQRPWGESRGRAGRQWDR